MKSTQCHSLSTCVNGNNKTGNLAMPSYPLITVHLLVIHNYVLMDFSIWTNQRMVWHSAILSRQRLRFLCLHQYIFFYLMKKFCYSDKLFKHIQKIVGVLLCVLLTNSCRYGNYLILEELRKPSGIQRTKTNPVSIE